MHSKKGHTQIFVSLSNTGLSTFSPDNGWALNLESGGRVGNHYLLRYEVEVILRGGKKIGAAQRFKQTSSQGAEPATYVKGLHTCRNTRICRPPWIPMYSEPGGAKIESDQWGNLKGLMDSYL